MANELKHVSTGIAITQAQYESTLSHIFNSQATGDTMYASSATQLSRLGIGATNKILTVIGGVPTWQSTLAGLSLTSPIFTGTVTIPAGTTTLTPASMGQLPHRNAIINGAALVNQRVSAYTLVKDTYGISGDRWYGMATGTAVSAGTFTNTAAANCGVSGYAFKFVAVTLTGTGIIYHRYRMEAKDAVRFKNQTASFRCQVYQDTGGAINYTIYVRKANAADNFAAVTAISDSGAISVPNTTATSLPYLAIAMGDCSNGIEIEIKVAAGAITTKNFEFTELQLELSSVATPYEYRPFQQELALCQRYYEKSYDDGVAPATATNVGSSWITCPGGSAYIKISVVLKATKRTTPTIVWYSFDGTAGKATLAGADQNFVTNTAGTNAISGQLDNVTPTEGQDLAAQFTAAAEL